MSQIVADPPGFRLATWATSINVLVSVGFSIAGVLHPAAVLPAGDAPNHAAAIFALYAAARALAIATIALVVVYRKATAELLAVGALAGFVQLLDAGVGLYQGDPGKTLGPLAIALVQFAALWPMLRPVATDRVRAA